MKIYELTPTNGKANSFYGKAKVIENETEKILVSYNTEVAKINSDNEFKILIDTEDKKVFSNTTIRHIREFYIQNVENKSLTTKEMKKFI